MVIDETNVNFATDFPGVILFQVDYVIMIHHFIPLWTITLINTEVFKASISSGFCWGKGHSPQLCKSRFHCTKTRFLGIYVPKNHRHLLFGGISELSTLVIPAFKNHNTSQKRETKKTPTCIGSAHKSMTFISGYYPNLKQKSPTGDW